MSAGWGGVNKRKSYKIDLSTAYLKCRSISSCWWQLSQINTSLSDQVSGPRASTRCTDICRVAFSRPERHHGHVQLGTDPSFLLILFKYFPFPCHSAVLHCFKYWWLFRILIWSFNFAIWCFGVLHILWDTLYLVCTFLSEYIYSNCYQGALCPMVVCCRCLVLCLFNLTRIVLDLLYFGVGQWRQTKLSITVVAEVYWNYLNV